MLRHNCFVQAGDDREATNSGPAAAAVTLHELPVAGQDQATLNQQELSTSPRLAKLEEEAQELCTLVKKGRLSSIAAQAALDAIERERTELAFQASRDERRVYEEAMKVIPQSAALYRAAVHDLNSTLHDPTERAEARALIAELLGRQVKIRQDGAAVFARLEIDEAVLLASAAKSLEIKDFQVGGGGRI